MNKREELILRLQEFESHDRETGLSPDDRAIYNGYRTILAQLDQEIARVAAN